MTVAIKPIPVPLHDDGHGGLRVGETGVSFESVWRIYQEGSSPGEIVEAFDTLDLADVCTLLAWALRHPDEVNAYLKDRDDEAAQVRRQLEEAGVSPTPQQAAQFKEQLTVRRKRLQPRGADDASPSDG